MKILNEEALKCVAGGHAWNPWHSSTAINSAFNDGKGHIATGISPAGAAAVCGAVAAGASAVAGPLGAALGTAVCGGVAAANTGNTGH